MKLARLLTWSSGHVELEWKLEDLWIGAFWRVEQVDAGTRPVLEISHYKPASLLIRTATFWHIWICLIPTLPLHVTYCRHVDEATWP